jgi:probable rRNA maturation factor
VAGLDLEDVPADLREPVLAALRAAGVDSGHISLELVGEERIRQLNREHRDRDKPTDVLSFPIDGTEPVAGPRELGDIVICPEHTEDLVEATVHGVLHLCGYDHEEDDGQMLELQGRIIAKLHPSPNPVDPGREAEESTGVRGPLGRDAEESAGGVSA